MILLLLIRYCTNTGRVPLQLVHFILEKRKNGELDTVIVVRENLAQERGARANGVQYLKGESMKIASRAEARPIYSTFVSAALQFV